MMHADQSGTPTPRIPAGPLARLAAFALDAATYLIIPALLLRLGLLLIRRGVMLSSVAVNAVGLALVIAPATAWATRHEAGREEPRRVSGCCGSGLSMRAPMLWSRPGEAWPAT
jgi:hypothetical protein